MEEARLIISEVDKFYNKVTNELEYNSDVLTFIFERVMYHYCKNPKNAYLRINQEILYKIESFSEYDTDVFQIFDILDSSSDFYLEMLKKWNLNPRFLALFTSLVIRFYNAFKNDASHILSSLINNYLVYKNPSPSLEELTYYLSKISLSDLANKIYESDKKEKELIR